VELRPIARTLCGTFSASAAGMRPNGVSVSEQTFDSIGNLAASTQTIPSADAIAVSAAMRESNFDTSARAQSAAAATAAAKNDFIGFMP
jgi:hypothetical protein